MKHHVLLSVAAIAAFGVVAARAVPVVYKLPEETAAFKPGPNLDVVQANCTGCHSADYISSQPPMPRKFWDAEVKKMIEKYAAPTPAEVTATLAEYLTATYGVP